MPSLHLHVTHSALTGWKGRSQAAVSGTPYGHYNSSYSPFSMYSTRSSKPPHSSSSSLPLITPYPPPLSFESPLFTAAAIFTGGAGTSSLLNRTLQIRGKYEHFLEYATLKYILYHPGILSLSKFEEIELKKVNLIQTDLNFQSE